MLTFDELSKIHAELFAETNLNQQCAKFEEEQDEYKKALYRTEESLYELADMVIVSAGVARFNYTEGIGMLVHTINNAEFSVGDIWQAVEKKVEKLRKRVWIKDPVVGYKHTKGVED